LRFQAARVAAVGVCVPASSRSSAAVAWLHLMFRLLTYFSFHKDCLILLISPRLPRSKDSSVLTVPTGTKRNVIPRLSVFCDATGPTWAEDESSPSANGSPRKAGCAQDKYFRSRGSSIHLESVCRPTQLAFLEPGDSGFRTFDHSLP
jgi:hypothetical protein